MTKASNHLKLSTLLVFASVTHIATATDTILNNNGQVCATFANRIEASDFSFEKYSPKMQREMKVFIGENPLKYNKDDFYLFVYSYDVNNNQTQDLIAIDWRPRGGSKFYLAYYVYEGKGNLMSSGDADLLTDKRAVENFLKKKKFLHRRNKEAAPNSELSAFSDTFEYQLKDGTKMKEGFVGYYEILPMIIGSKNYVVAKKAGEMKISWHVYDFSINPEAPDFLCYLKTDA